MPKQLLADDLEKAVQLHQAGDLSQAASIYRRILQNDSNNADALHLLGLTAFQTGENDIAVDLINKAIGEDPLVPSFHNNLGNAFQSKGSMSEAIKCFKETVRLEPNYVKAYLNLGNVFQEQEKYDDAIEQYEMAIALRPDSPEVRNNLGNVLKEQGKLDEAIDCYKKAIKLRPDYSEVYFNMGKVFKEQDKLDKALECLEKSISLKDNFPEVYNELGTVYEELKKPDAAIEQYKKAMALKPDFPEVWNNLGNVFMRQDKYNEAMDCYKKAIKLRPDFAEAFNNLGRVIEEQGKLSEAIMYYQKAIQIKPDFSSAHLNRGLSLLRNGDFEEGWPEYEWRFGRKTKKGIGYHNFTKPRWDGSLLAGKRIVVSSEQGVGDCIQCIRYLPFVKQHGGYLIFECYDKLMELLADFGDIDLLIKGPIKINSELSYDLYIPLLSLPGIFGATGETIIKDVPYLRGNAERVKEWKYQMDCDAFKIGLVWAGSPTHKNDRNRSCDLSIFEPLTSIPDVRLFSLQKEITGEQSKLLKEMNIANLDDRLEDFSHTAAVIENLDLVISVDTAVVHLAGAMGKPVWTLLPFVPDWRWMIGRDDSPWYPTMRLFRQTKREDWEGVIAEVAGELVELVR